MVLQPNRMRVGIATAALLLGAFLAAATPGQALAFYTTGDIGGGGGGAPPVDDGNGKKDKPACSDKKDNDGDGKTDYPHDPGCTGPKDNDERNGGGGCPLNAVIINEPAIIVDSAIVRKAGTLITTGPVVDGVAIVILRCQI